MSNLDKLARAEQEYAEYQAWYNEGMVSAAELESKRRALGYAKLDVMAD